MSDEVNKAVKEAIIAARGDAQGAIRFLKLLLDRDEKLLREMVEPYLQGILFQHVDGMLKKVKARKGGAEEPATAATGAPPAGVSSSGAKPAPKATAKPAQVLKPAKEGVLDQIVDRLAANIPPQPRQPRPPRTAEEALASIGRDPNGPPPPKAGPRHQSALREVAKSFKKF